MNCALPTLRGARVVLRPLRPEDADVLAGLVGRPEVAPWWGSRPEDFEHHRAGFIEDAEENAAFAIDEEPEPDYHHASMDIFLAPERHGAGHGPQALRLAARWLIEDRGHHRLTIDPSAENERAIAVYRSIGFRPIGIMRSYERGNDGAWHDALLMDLLAHELR